jgi:anti-sigma factor RsiW
VIVQRPKRKGMGQTNAASCPDEFGGDPCAALLAQAPPQAVAAAQGLPTSWLTTPFPALGGMPGWAIAVFGALAFVMVIGMAGGRR